MKTTTKTRDKKEKTPKQKTEAELENERMDAAMTEWEKRFWTEIAVG